MAEYNETLELPKWNLFVQLIRNILEYPGSAFVVPNLLRRMSSDILLNKHVLLDVAPSNLLSLKYAMLTVGYFCAAGELPHEFEKYLVSELVAVQSRLVTDARKDADKTHPGAGGEEQLKLPPGEQ